MIAPLRPLLRQFSQPIGMWLAFCRRHQRNLPLGRAGAALRAGGFDRFNDERRAS